MPIVLSLGQRRLCASVSSAFSYIVPSVIAAQSNISIFPNSTNSADSTHRHSVFLTGSGFGSSTSTSVIDATVHNIINSCVWCSTVVDLASADLSLFSNQAIITGLSLQVRIYNSEDPSAGIYRFDDIDLVLLSPANSSLRLTRNKCFGTNPPSIVAAFQLFSLNMLPVSRCSFTGTYAFPDFVDGTPLVNVLATSSAFGVWKLQISKSQPDKFSISDISMKFTVSDTIAVIGQTAVVDQIWTSDSSMNLKVSHGAGKSHHGKVLVKFQSSTGSLYFSYPVPSVISRNGNSLQMPRTSTAVVLIGKYFSVYDATSRSSSGSSVCQSNPWISDSSLICKTVPVSNRINLSSLRATVQSQASVASIPLISYSSFDLYSSFYTDIEKVGISTSSVVFFVGKNLGCSSGSESLRLFTRHSSSVTSSWVSESSIFSKFQISDAGLSGVWLSIYPASRNFSNIPISTLISTQIEFIRTPAGVKNGAVASTGGVRIVVAGSSMRPYDTSVSARFGLSASRESIWISDSALMTKVSAGMASSSTAFVGSVGTSTGSVTQGISYNLPAVNADANIFFNNSLQCMFNVSNSSKCLRLDNGSSGFGTARPSIDLLVKQGPEVAPWPNVMSCNAIYWVSDSAVYCSFSSFIFPQFSTLRVDVISTTDAPASCDAVAAKVPLRPGGAVGAGASQSRQLCPASHSLQFLNPFYIPISPVLNETIFFRFYSILDYNNISSSSISQYMQFGNTTNVLWPASSKLLSLQHSETLTFKIVAIVNANQPYLDAASYTRGVYQPIQSNIRVRIQIWNGSDSPQQVICNQNGTDTVSLIQLEASSFLAVQTISIAVCSPVFSHFKLVYDVTVTNSDDQFKMLQMSEVFSVFPPGSPSLKLAELQLCGQSDGNNTASCKVGVRYMNVLRFRFNFSSSLDETCELQDSSVLSYTILLQCSGSHTEFLHRGVRIARIDVPTCRRCLESLSDVKFLRPSANCSFVVSVTGSGQTLRVATPMFFVQPGAAVSAKLLGAGPFCASAGALVWSSNATGNRCLEAQLQDEESNNVTSPVSVQVVAKSAYGTYDIARSKTTISDASGIARWCDAYSSSVLNALITFGASIAGGFVSWWNNTLVNVSAVGPLGGLAPVNSSFFSTQQALASGSAPPKILFSFQDAGGNAISKLPENVTYVIRVRVVPRAAAVGGRRLLGLAPDTACTGAPLEFDFPLQAGATSVSAGANRVCSAGLNDIIFDVGVFDSSGTFITVIAGVSSITVNVLLGRFELVRMVAFPPDFTARSYELIQNLEFQFMDSGLNEVPGNASITLACGGGGAVMFPSLSFSVSANISNSTKAVAPPFFMYVSKWHASAPLHVSSIKIINSSVPVHGADFVTIQLRPTCNISRHIIFSVPENAALLSQLLSNSSFQHVSCTNCQSVVSNSLYHDSSECLTLKWGIPDMPLIVQSGKDAIISNVVTVNHLNQAAIIDDKKLVLFLKVSLLATVPNSAQTQEVSASSARLINGFSLVPTSKILPVYARKPGLGYRWFLQLVVFHQTNSTFLELMFSENVKVLDYAPQLRDGDVVPFDGLSYAGGTVITISGSFPFGVSPGFFAADAVLPRVQGDMCVFKSEIAGLSPIFLPANRSFASNSSIRFLCSALPPQITGPPHTKWSVSVQLEDGRESTGAATITSYCPIGFFVFSQNNGAQSCQQCPQGTGRFSRSTTAGKNMPSIQSCMCNVGYYGTFGDDCRACPSSKDLGFNCTQANQSRPIILPGFYIDYSKMGSCREDDRVCEAIIRCPNEAACPGTDEKQCLQTSEQCYNNASFGCTECCPRFYTSNYECLPCPDQDKLPLYLGLAVVALIIFAFASAVIHFPPFVSASQSLKVCLVGIQSFVSIRLINVSWPPIVDSMFDFTRFFTFSFDVVRPECTVDYSPQAKLTFLVLAPICCCILMLSFLFALWVYRCRAIAQSLSHESIIKLKPLNCWSFSRIFHSVSRCLLASALCRKFSNTRMMFDGALWNALNPRLALRSNTSILLQKSRRVGVVQTDFPKNIPLKVVSNVPHDWALMSDAVRGLDIHLMFFRTVVHVRLLLASAFSIFIFTFQGIIENALSTFDCKGVRIGGTVDFFLKSNPEVRCTFQDSVYKGMVTTTIICLIIYCALLPGAAMVVMRSTWCSNVYVHDNTAYKQLFGFFTDQYSKSYSLWELVSCFRKVVFVAIPVFISKNSLVQSVSIFVWLILYTFILLRFQPMASSTLNQIEIITSISIIVGSFASIFFAVEYEGVAVFKGASKETAGLLLVLFFAACGIAALRLMMKDVSRLMLINKDLIVATWMSAIQQCLGDACQSGFLMPIITLFYNKVSSADILARKHMRAQELAALHKQAQSLRSLPWYSFYSWFRGYFRIFLEKTKMKISDARFWIPQNMLDECVERPEFRMLTYLHTLGQRMCMWQKWADKNLPSDELPEYFHDVKGPSDPPLKDYSYYADVINATEQLMTPQMMRALTAIMLAELMNSKRSREHESNTP